MSVVSVWINRVLIFLGATGIFFTGVLSYTTWQKLSIPCGGHLGCAAVQNSPFSMVGPVSVSYIGLLGFVVLFALAVVRAMAPPDAYRKLGVLGLAMAGGGTLFSVVLTFISLSVIEQKCNWCLATLATIVATTIAYGALLQVDAPARIDSRHGLSVAAGAFILATSGLYMVVYGLERAIPLEFLLVRADQYTLEEVLPDESKIRGNSDAKVTIIEFADINCRACRDSYPKVKQILAKHGSGVRLAFRHFPLIGTPGHETSVDAALIAEYAASKGQFWQYMDAVMDINATERIKTLEGLFGVAIEAGLSRSELRSLFSPADEDQTEWATGMLEAVRDDTNFARNFGIRLTPTFIVYAEGVEPKVVGHNQLDATLMSPPFKQIIAGN